MKTVAVVDYGMGNLFSVAQAVRHVAPGSGFDAVVTSRPEDVRAADRVVPPVLRAAHGPEAGAVGAASMVPR